MAVIPDQDPTKWFKDTNINFLIAHRFRVVLRRSPGVVYFCQEAALPGITLGSATQATPFVDIPIYGDKLAFEDFSMTFAVDEDMSNYLEIFDWMVGIGFPQGFEQFRKLVKPDFSHYANVKSDLMVTILDNSENPFMNVHFRDCYPTSISGLNFDTKVSDANSIPATVTFKYTIFTFHRIPKPAPAQ